MVLVHACFIACPASSSLGSASPLSQKMMFKRSRLAMFFLITRYLAQELPDPVDQSHRPLAVGRIKVKAKSRLD